MGLEEILAKVRSQFLQVEVPGDAYQFSNRRGYGIAVKSVGYINERFQSALAESGHGWTYGVSSRGEEVLGHPFSSGAVRLVEGASKDPGIRLELEKLFSYLLDEPVSNETFSTTVSSLVDGVQRMVWSEADVPLLKALAPALKPGTGFVPRAVAFGGKVHRYDRFGVSSLLLARLLEVQPITQERPLDVFIDVFGDVNRVDPGSSSAWTQEDTGDIFRTFSEFLLDESRGLERMYQLMEQR